MKGERYAFVFSRPVAFPPNIHDMKCYYVSRELLSRGNRVTWVRLGGNWGSHRAQGIDFVSIRLAPTNTLFTAFSLLRLAIFCVARRVKVVYLDEWLFFRHRPMSRLAGVVSLRYLRRKVVLDERDPLVDFETATGEFGTGTPGYTQTVRSSRLSERMASLVILTSGAYARLYISEGFPAAKVLGVFRGVDPALFNPEVDPSAVRKRLGLDGKFVVGWFGLMHKFRQIGEVLVPLAGELSASIPDAHVLIGGEGPLQGQFAVLKAPGVHASVLGMVPYADLPAHIAACDVLLCPVDPRFRFTQHSAWLKIAEALAVGRPIIATRTRMSEEDYKDFRGVVWVDPDLRSFAKAIEEVRRDYPRYLALAQGQARHFEDYTVGNTISKIVDRVELLAGRGAN